MPKQHSLAKAIVEALNTIAVDYDQYECGLPHYDDKQMELMIAAVEDLIAPKGPN